MPTKCLIHNCTKPSVSKGLCDTHRKRVARNGTAENTRPADWGSKEKHPAYKAWCSLRRYHFDAMPEAWQKDFWAFVSDVPAKPKGRVTARRADASAPWSRDNFYWKEPIVDADKRADRAAYMREWSKKARANNPDYHKSMFLRRKYGIDISAYNRMLADQNGCCNICGKPESNEIKGKVVSLAVDHDHTTGAIRALLCGNCNRGLGLFNDSTDLLDKARAYLKRHRA